MITTIGVSYILFNVILLGAGADSKNYSNPMPNIRWESAMSTLRLREVLLWGVSLLLMVGLNYFVRRTKMGKAMQATAQDQEAARMVGVDVDRVVIITFFLGSALAGAAGLIFGLYYNYTSFIIGYTAGLRAFTAAVLGGIGNIPGAMLGGVLIGLIESLGGQYIAVRWTDVIIFSILVLVLVFRPTGLLGRAAPTQILGLRRARTATRTRAGGSAPGDGALAQLDPGDPGSRQERAVPSLSARRPPHGGVRLPLARRQ